MSIFDLEVTGCNDVVLICNANVHEFELSAHDHAEEPGVALVEAIILTTDP